MYVCMYVCNVCMCVCNVCMHVCRVGCHVVAGTRQCHAYVVPPSRVEPAAGMAMGPVSHGSGASPNGSSGPDGGVQTSCLSLININYPQTTLTISGTVSFGKYEENGAAQRRTVAALWPCFARRSGNTGTV